MKHNSKIIAIILAVLTVITGVAAMINYNHAREQLALLEKEEIILSEKGAEIGRITLTELSEMGPVEFQAELKSSVMPTSEEHAYTGVVLSELFRFVGISIEGKSRVTAESLDGYRVPLKVEEVMALDNVFLVYKDNGEYLGTYDEAGGQGPYMIVIRGDRFSQRWAKYVIRLDIE